VGPLCGDSGNGANLAEFAAGDSVDAQKTTLNEFAAFRQLTWIL
jgi:hypothetical protein